MENIKNCKLEDIKRLCKELNSENITEQIIEKINACKTLDEINEFDCVSEILEIKNTLEFQKQEQIQNLKIKISNEIYELYPQNTQINASLGLEEGIKKDMIAFIEERRNEYKILKNRILKCESIEKLKNINI